MTKVSVIIPTKNGGEKFKEVLEMVRKQETDFNFEVVVIDSGSRDGTVEYIEAMSQIDDQIRCYKIEPKDFGHGKTRNFGVSKAKGDFVAFITQDALPYNEKWLANLVDSFRNDPKVAGVFGKHLPYEDTYPIEKKQIIDHFDLGFGKERLEVRITDREDYKKRQGWYIFYSDNNSCMRKEVMKKIPFKDVWMAEDQNWAKDILESGYKKVYEPTAIVYHSHKYSLGQVYKRVYDEFRFHSSVGNVEKASKRDALNFYWNSYKYSFSTIRSLCIPMGHKIRWILFYLLYDLVRAFGYYKGTNGDESTDSKNSMQKQIINS